MSGAGEVEFLTCLFFKPSVLRQIVWLSRLPLESSALLRKVIKVIEDVRFQDREWKGCFEYDKRGTYKCGKSFAKPDLTVGGKLEKIWHECLYDYNIDTNSKCFRPSAPIATNIKRRKQN